MPRPSIRQTTTPRTVGTAPSTQPVQSAQLSHSAEPRASFLQGAAWQRMMLASVVLGTLWLVLLASLSAAD